MNAALLSKVFWAAAFGAAFAWVVSLRSSAESGPGTGKAERPRYLPYVTGFLLPLYVVMLMGVECLFHGGKSAAQAALDICFGVFAHICVYDAVLIAVLPLLRRHFSARACAMLWIIPNYLYITDSVVMELQRPLLVLSAPGAVVPAAVAVWAAGFVLVLGGKILSHVLFRAGVLREASTVTEPEVLGVWRSEISRAGMEQAKLRLVRSPAVTTPLTVGLFRRGMRVVLPDRAYSSEDLSLIFRHELIHIGRQDPWSKFFLVFCTAMCWFNPLMWLAMRRSADDLELSCDETVLLGCGEGERRRYAELLLKTAGDERGFTTCLSATAAALRYRMRNVMQPARKRSGALLVGLVFFVLCMSSGWIALAYGGGTGAELIYGGRDASEFRLSGIEVAEGAQEAALECLDTDALAAYLSSLELRRLTGNHSLQTGRELTVRYDAPEGALFVILSDEAVEIAPLYGDAQGERYYLPGGADWDALGAIVTPVGGAARVAGSA